MAAIAWILLASSIAVAQVAPSRLPADRLDGPPLAEVLVLGTYHMGNPGRDIFNMKADDVLAPKRQAEIRELLDVLARFRPTKIAIEANSNSPKIKQYQDYLAGKYELGRDERDQIGFRLGKELALPKIYGIDEQEDFSVLHRAGLRQGPRARKGTGVADGAFREEGAGGQRVPEVAQRAADAAADQFEPAVRRDLANYALFAHFGEEDDYAGAELLHGLVQRNIRIFTHLLAIIEPGDRVLVIYGAGHLRILRQNRAGRSDPQAAPTRRVGVRTQSKKARSGRSIPLFCGLRPASGCRKQFRDS